MRWKEAGTAKVQDEAKPAWTTLGYPFYFCLIYRCCLKSSIEAKAGDCAQGESIWMGPVGHGRRPRESPGH